MNDQRIFIVGDIHGCLDPFKRLMDRIPWRPSQDRLIFLGDYIDRGENARGVVDYIVAISRCSAKVDCLLGNHEAILMDYLENKDHGLFLINGGWSTVESYGSRGGADLNSLIPPEHMDFYKSLKTYVELEDYYVVHAGFRPGVPMEAQVLEDMVWIREPFIYSDYDFGKRVIFGHTPFEEPLVMKNKIGVDTGAVYGNKLTCLELPSLKFHSVEA